MSFVLLALIRKEFPLWLYPPLRAGRGLMESASRAPEAVARGVGSCAAGSTVRSELRQRALKPLK
jgi:hypothetical protein